MISVSASISRLVVLCSIDVLRVYATLVVDDTAGPSSVRENGMRGESRQSSGFRLQDSSKAL